MGVSVETSRYAFCIDHLRLRWDPDLSPRDVGLSPQGWEDDHNEEEQAYP